MPKINFALGLPPGKAIEWLKTKQVTAENYRNLTASEIAKVYTIARMTDLDMLNDIKQSMVKAASDGQSYSDWNKNLLQHLQNKGWLHPNGHDGKVIIDPNSGEVFGAPRRLENIYRTNMQTAYSAGQYQGYMANIDSRPYWMYDAVGDHRTRPAHAAMDGLVYRYDDPFWTTFYPPNGYRCRCSVIALSERDMQRDGKVLSQSGEHNLVETHKVYNKKGDSYPTIAYKAPDGSLHTTDRGFGYNAGRMNYRPNLDQYDRGLAHEFAKAEMGGEEFKAVFKQLSEEIDIVKNRLGLEGKLAEQALKGVRNALDKKFVFAAGLLPDSVKEKIGSGKATVWLSENTLIKQIENRKGQDFGLEHYAALPEMLQGAEDIEISRDSGKNKWWKITGYFKGKPYLMVIKHIGFSDELYLESVRRMREK